MLKKLLLLLVLLLVWVALLWFVMAIDLNKHSNLALLGMHLLPPLVLWGGWLWWRAWRNRRHAAKQAEAEAAKQAELQREREVKRAAFDKELAERRSAVDCRWLQVRDLAAHTAPDNLAVTADGVSVLVHDPAWTELAHDAGVSWPGPQLTELFVDLLSACPAAVSFPIYLQGPSDQSFAELTEMIHALREQAMAHVELDLSSGVRLGPILGLPQSAASPQELIDLFNNQPELPGAVVLAFESPLARQQTEAESWLTAEEMASPHNEWLGKPGQALIGMVLTPPALPDALASIEAEQIKPGDVMTPYWERGTVPAGLSAALAQLPLAWRQALHESPVLGQLRSPAFLEMDQDIRAGQLAQQLRRLLEVAGINASLIEPQLEPDIALEADPAPAWTLSDSAWLVHNAGGVNVCGTRLAGVVLAFTDAGVELSPTQEATNVVVHAGDCGRALPYLMLGLGVAKAAMLKKPALITQFHDRQVSVSVVMPTQG